VAEQKTRGRPKDMEKRAAILRAAHQLFLGRGLSAVTIDDVAGEAGVSKMTVYSNFEDKEAIFEAVVGAQAGRMEDTFQQIQIGGGRVDVVLTSYGMALLSFLFSPEIMRFDQILSSETNNHIDLGRRFYRAGPGKILTEITAIIRSAVKNKELYTQDPQQAAEDLISLWLGMIPLQYRFNQLESVSEATISKRVKHGVAVLMKTNSMLR
jgi:TetR/AcrR family transcriptional regulator, mexJK operon transcriptional repressor